MAFGEGGPPPGQIRDKAHEILSRAEFGRTETLLQRVIDWIGDLFSWLSFGVGGGSGFFGNLVGLAIIAAIVYVLVLLARALLGRERRQKDEDGDELTIELEEGRPASDWRADAERFEAAGQWREAMRARYRELVRALIEERVLEDLPGRTTGEYRTAYVAARPSHAAAFAALTELFESVWYGGVETGAEENARFRRLADEARAPERAGV